MITLRIIILAVMIGSSVPPHSIDIGNPIERQQISIQIPAIVEHAAPVVSVKDKAIVKPTINEGRSYKQVVEEAFERVYKEVNLMLDETVDNYGCAGGYNSAIISAL